MASKEDGKGNSVVRFDGTSPESVHVELQSPAKNRAKGTPVGQNKPKGPVLFERASGSWWNPKFDSPILEKALLRHYFPHTRRQFQYALLYIVVACVAWSIFFGLMKLDRWTDFVVGALALAVVCTIFLIFTRIQLYERFVVPTSVFVSVLVGSLILATFAYDEPNISLVGTFSGSLEVLLLLYTFFPMPIIVSVTIGVVYSVVYEVFVAIRNEQMQGAPYIVSKALLHFCLHMMGIHIYIISQVMHRSNFWKVGQSMMARRDLQVEKQIKERMIHSLMPKTVADAVMKRRPENEKEEEDDASGGRKRKSKSKRAKGEIIFRSFNMNQMNQVSILFADIVGFTKMSSNKTAEHLVGLLNDLFGRFDKLCNEVKCEKISTLGDCYYCVAGCPEPQPDHAECCVLMGLGMIKAIKEFDDDNNEQVNMRVGVHTGTVLCGIVGTRRFKFDVWSNDVTLANIMESTGRPGMVHISESSYALLKDKYEVEEGEDVEDMRTHKKLIEHYDATMSSFTIKHEQDQKVIKTYFITGIRGKMPSMENLHETPNSVIIGMDGADESQDKKDEVGGAADGAVNHLERESSVNGVSPVVLLGRRHSAGFLEVGEITVEKSDDKDDHVDTATVPFKESWTSSAAGAGQEELDKLIIRYINEDVTDKEFFYQPPINTCTLSFLQPALEEDYRSHYFDSELFREESVASPRYHSFIEVMLSVLIFILVSVCCFLVFERSIVFVAVFVACLVLEVLVLVDVATDVKIGGEKKDRCPRYARCMSAWATRNLVGIMMAILPAIAVYANLSCDLALDDEWSDRFFCFCIILSLLNFCNFSMLSSWLKSILATLVGLVLLLILSVTFCEFSWTLPPSTTAPTVASNASSTLSTTTLTQSTASMNTSSVYSHKTGVPDHLFSGENMLRYEIILDVILLLLLIWFLNREFEISYRLSFHGSAQAVKDTRQMQENKDQADWLLHNIIPEHVSDVVKRTSKYSKNHKDIGVIFATIVNFNEFYDEGFEGGREYLRVLNELVSDYEELLDRKRFKDVEKIKTISASFMAASGLNEASRLKNAHPHAHLFALMDFAMELQRVVQNFNESIFNFEFVLNIGYNFGEVTAGVIGTTKLLYDIWGDTVNIASRMYSTGAPNRIQVPEATVSVLSEMFEFEYRDEIFVKGKGNMRTFLLTKMKDGASWE